jgi:hypothetical protein
MRLPCTLDKAVIIMVLAIIYQERLIMTSQSYQYKTIAYHYLRLFDLEKYREIQPTIEGIAKRDIKLEVEQVISLVKAAASVLQTEDFKEYNDEECLEDNILEMDEILGSIEEGDISKMFAFLDKRKNPCVYDALRIMVFLICCPKYQEEVAGHEPKQNSGTTIEYSDIFWWRNHSSNLNIFRMLEYPGVDSRNEEIPIESNETGNFVSILSQPQIEELQQTLVPDILMLLKFDISPDMQEEYLKFYDDFNFLLRLANARDEYTIVNVVRC